MLKGGVRSKRVKEEERVSHLVEKNKRKKGRYAKTKVSEGKKQLNIFLSTKLRHN